jgi:hypothetical protein
MKTYLVTFVGFRPSVALLADSLGEALAIATRRYCADVVSIELV